MSKVWIVCADSVVCVVNVAELQPAARIRSTQKQCKPVAKKAPVLVRFATAPAPLQCGGTLVSSKMPSYWSKDDSSEHYRQRCNENNNRKKSCFKTALRRQVVYY